MHASAPTLATGTAPATSRSPSTLLDRFSYDDDIVRKFLWATLIWGLVGMLAGLVIALQLANPIFNLGNQYTGFGRLRPLHTNAVIFAFAGNAWFTGAYYASQRLLKTRMWSDALSKFHFWGWQAIIVAAALTLPLGITQAKEYAELEWPIDLAVVVVWVAFAVNFTMTMVKSVQCLISSRVPPGPRQLEGAHIAAGSSWHTLLLAPPHHSCSATC
ncbi:MAG: cbb3-type cytochrome c oxidase subunit I [Gemmatimonadaceae bacterium]|nr:cbb3-type cytochrome c oxidase subunit I [Gemmatimonadaceae bacterium]